MPITPFLARFSYHIRFSEKQGRSLLKNSYKYKNQNHYTDVYISTKKSTVHINFERAYACVCMCVCVCVCERERADQDLVNLVFTKPYLNFILAF